MPETRPNPDDLLKAVQSDPGARGRLKVFLGASAGVGKTFSMLSAAQEQARRGVDIQIGYIETHGRPETQALVDGLEVIPLKAISHRGTTIPEMDVDEILRRKPQVVLVDELPHSNAPGSRHAKRWQDIEELLDAGIDVFTAMNIQHLESLNDVVAQVTGVRVSETVPDAFFDQATDIELVDIPPAELRQRLRDGKVYIAERVQQALEGFFKTSNLTALRELALRRTADTVDAEMQRLRVQEGVRGQWATKERIVVCIAPNRLASRVIRAAARLGAASHAELIALNVESDRQASRTTDEHESVQDALELAQQLGMEVVTLQGHDIVSEVMAFANRRNATLIVVGKPVRPRWKELLFGSVVDELVRTSGDIDVHVITAEAAASKTPFRRPKAIEPVVTGQGVAIVVVATIAATLIGLSLSARFDIANVAMVYLLFVALAAMRCTRVESILNATLSVLCFNFFFVEPRFTLAVTDARDLFVFVVMLTVAFVVSTLTHRLRGQLKASSQRERRTSSLYALSRQLAQGRSKREIAHGAAKEIRDVFEGDVAIFLREPSGLSLLASSESSFEGQPNEQAVASWVADHGEAAGLGTDTLPGASALYLPLSGAESTIGVIAFKPARTLEGVSERQLLDTFANGLGLALERAVLAKQSNEARVQAESERIRSTLLSSISHDLRTPLTSITGAASSLVEGSGNTRELAKTIYSESVRLNHQIQNLLDMTRLQSGNVVLDLQWHSVPDLIASALRAASASLGSREVNVVSPPDLPLLLVDGLLIDKALTNLLENVGRHTGANVSLSIGANVDSSYVLINVQDNGPGLQTSDLEALFKPGYRTPGGGYGLGLAVVKAVVELHGGSVQAENAAQGGAIFTIRLPIPANQPDVPLG